MKSVALMSGGKDSFLSALIAMEQGFEVGLSLTVIPEEDSFMYHVPNAAMASYSAEILGIQWQKVREDRVRETIEGLAQTGYRALIAGAIASSYQKTRLESLCTEMGMCLFTPLWLLDQEKVLNELILRNIRAIIVSASAEGMEEKDIGREIDEEFIEEMKRRSRKVGLNISGEGGEYESFVLGFMKKNIKIVRSEKYWNGQSGHLLIREAHLSNEK
jgi:ABC transporter with metal-binding/Fe-S-binding domain ATP-binding protein